MNILREMRLRITLTFNCKEVHTLITQVAWQIETFSPTSNHHKRHADLGQKEFGKVLVDQLTKLLQRVRANWLEGVTVRTISVFFFFCKVSYSLLLRSNTSLNSTACLTSSRYCR